MRLGDVDQNLTGGARLADSGDRSGMRERGELVGGFEARVWRALRAGQERVPAPH
jgi:hypothetical protein